MLVLASVSRELVSLREALAAAVEIIELPASFYTIGSSAYRSGIDKLNDHILYIREGRDALAELAKSAVVTSLREASVDFERLAASADRFSDNLLELDVEETLFTAMQLKQEADSLERRTLQDIRADLIAVNQRRSRRPPKRFE